MGKERKRDELSREAERAALGAIAALAEEGCKRVVDGFHATAHGGDMSLEDEARLALTLVQRLARKIGAGP